MADDRASRRLEVDEQGIPRRISNDPWSNTTSRHVQILWCSGVSFVSALVALGNPAVHIFCFL